MLIKTFKSLFKHMPLISTAVVILCAPNVFAAEKPKDEWQTRENLLTRLGGEWYKIRILMNELQNMQQILQDLQDFEIFPYELTRLSDESLVLFDKKIEVVAKKHQALQQRVEELRSPLIDAMAILREMVTGQPVEDMFQVLDNDDIRRISAMFAIKHHIDSLWRDFDGLFSVLSTMVQIPQPAQEETRQGFESDFFDILKANLGRQSERFYKMLNDIKDTLYQRGSEDCRARMFQVESHRIKDYLKSGNAALAQMKLPGIAARYKQSRFTDECHLLQVKVSFAMGDFEQVLRTVGLLPEGSAALLEVWSEIIRSMYTLKRYDDLLRLTEGMDLESMSAEARNLTLWLTLESALATGKTDMMTALSAKVVKDSSYALHILHCLGRYYVAIGDWNTAQSVFESALRQNTPKKQDVEAKLRIESTLAQSYYQRGQYQKALTIFFNVLNHEEHFAEALYGISWCYLAMGNDAKAETSLRKLINLAPGSPYAVEGLLVTMERYCAKARNDWDKFVSLTHEQQRLIERRELLIEKASIDTVKRRTEACRLLVSKIDDLLLTLQGETNPAPADIAASYDKVQRIAELIEAYYETGTFQEISFSEKRENVLRRLDSLLFCVKGQRAAGDEGAAAFFHSMGDVLKIKEYVAKSKVISVEALIDRFRWEREYIDWQKTSIKRETEAMVRTNAKASDSLRRTVMSSRQRTLSGLMDSLVRGGDEVNKRWFDLLTQKCEEVLRLPPDSANEAYLRYHLGEICYNEENEKYSASYGAFEDSMTVFDSLMTLYRDGKLLQIPRRPVEPILNHRASKEQFLVILKKFPRSSLAHAVHYSLAWCYNDQGVFDSAVTHMQYLADNYPQSPYCPQAWMYLGEHMFDHAKLDRALKAYQAVLKFPESEWFDKALYKLAWTHYRLSNPEKAIGSFLALVDLGGGPRSGKTLLQKESIDYIAISFSETDVTGEKGLERAAHFVRRFGDQVKGAQILHRLATIFKDQGRFDMAQKTYATLLRTYPDNQNSPLIESELLAVLEKNSSVEEANIGRIEFFNKYNKNGSWARLQTDRGTKLRGDSLACKLLYEAAISYHQLALQKNDTTMYAAAADNYQTFIANYPQAPQASECHYNFAEIMFSLGNYQRAAEEYMAVSKRYPDSKYKETAAWNAIVASQNLLKRESGVVR